MTKAQAQGLNLEQAQRFYRAYAVLMDAFEEVYDGIHGARQHKEYHALRDSRRNCYDRYCELAYSQNKLRG